MAGKYITAVCWGIVYTYTNELFPTVVRLAVIGQLAAILASDWSR